MNDLRRRVNALRRKMARALAVVRLRPWPRIFAPNGTRTSPAPGPCPNPMPLSAGWPRPDSASPPSWRPTATWSGAAARTPFPAAMSSSAPFSPGPRPSALGLAG